MDEINQEKKEEKLAPEERGSQEEKEDIIKNEFPHEDLNNINQEKKEEETAPKERGGQEKKRRYNSK